MAGEQLLEIEGLRVVPMVDPSAPPMLVGVDLAIAPHEIVGIVGASGSGKTTLLRSVIRLPRRGVAIVAGSVVYRGRDLLTVSDEQMRQVRGREIALIPQNPTASLDPMRTVEKHIVQLARDHGIERTGAAVRELLRDVGISDVERVARAYPHELSGGMAQRVLIGMALTLEPQLLLADEPTSALDVTIQAQIMELIASTVRERGTSVLFVTHDIALAANYCNRVVVMRDGAIVEMGPAEEVVHAPQDEYTRDLLAAAGAGTPPTTQVAPS